MDAKINNWHVSPKEAVQIQRELREQIRLQPLQRPVTYIGGADVSMNMFAKEGFAGFVTLRYDNLEEKDHAVVKDTIGFPYIPGLLSFREIPMLLQAWKKLKTKPDVLMVDGVGIAHPRRMGIATHLGIALNIPTIGCSKNILTGTYEEPSNEAGSYTYMHDPKHPEEILGIALRSKKNVKPVFISPGHLITLEESIEIAKACIRKHRLPEPTRAAHNTMNQYRMEDNTKKSESHDDY